MTYKEHTITSFDSFAAECRHYEFLEKMVTMKYFATIFVLWGLLFSTAVREIVHPERAGNWSYLFIKNNYLYCMQVGKRNTGQHQSATTSTSPEYTTTSSTVIYIGQT